MCISPEHDDQDPVPIPSPPDPPHRLYRVAHLLVSLAMRIFFRRLAVPGAERIPAEGPVILAANHPSGIVDAFALGLATPRQVHFTARSTLFEGRWAWVLRRLGVLPLYRRLDAAAEMSRNVEAFQACFELLERGGVIGIFPEGITHVDPQVKEMRTGAVRMGLEAEARCGFRLGVRIVPVGISFSDPGAFRSNLTLRVGEPLELLKYADAYAADAAATVRQVNAELRRSIEELIVHLDDLSKRPIVEAAWESFGPTWVKDAAVLPEIEDEPSREIEIKRRIAGAITYYERFQPAWAVNLQRHLDGYQAALRRLHLTEEMLRRRTGPLPLLRETLPAAVVGILGAPLALFGWLINGLPQLLTNWLAQRLAAEPTQLAAYKMWIGLQAFAVCYGLVVVLLHRLVGLGRLEMLLAFVLLPVTGYLASRYFALLRHWRESVRLTSLQLLRRGNVGELQLRRERLARDRERIRAFLQAPPGGRPASA
jgi:glycerol-3-phosphate O-acyltransferase / dihydroxyacetone phosphate acyltransferase